MNIKSIYKRYGIVGIIQNFSMKVVELFGFEGFQTLKLMSIDLKQTEILLFEDALAKPDVLKLKDFEKCNKKDPIKFSETYLSLVKQRFSDPSYLCIGFTDNNSLISFGWICIGKYPLTNRILKDRAAFLFDDYTLPSYRGRGLHSLIIGSRLNWLKDKGYDIAYSSVALYNKASYKGFFKSGMRTKTIYAIWGKDELTMTLKSIFI